MIISIKKIKISEKKTSKFFVNIKTKNFVAQFDSSIKHNFY